MSTRPKEGYRRGKRSSSSSSSDIDAEPEKQKSSKGKKETRARRSQQRGYEKSARGDASVGASSGASGGATCGDDEDITQQLKGLSLYPQDENVGDGAPYVRVLNSVECRKRYLQFIGNAAAKANNHPGRVTLCIASAPHLHVNLFVEVLRAIGDTNIYRRVVFFLRKSDFIFDIFNVSAEVREFFRENMAHGNITVFLSKKPKYFHTKWAAYTTRPEKTEQRETEILLTSANIIKYHMNEGEPGDSEIFNSMVLYQSSDETQVSVINQMLENCKVQVDKISESDFVTYGEAKPQERDTTPCVIPNLSSKEIYNRIRESMQDTLDNIGNRPSQAGHTIYIVSPFIAMIKTTEQTGCSNVIRRFIRQFTTMLSKCSQNKPVLNIVYNQVYEGHTHKEIIEEEIQNLKHEHKSNKNISFIVACNKFHCKFIAYVAPDSDAVRVLHTSANFNDENMTTDPEDKYSNLDWLADEITITRAQWNEIKRDIGF